ncbi:MAG: hypothetical protein CL844_05070 [Crocinitomicaceae bacterium]|nr:hypothetical protein [Crocinitomicaceae bacterium]
MDLAITAVTPTAQAVAAASVELVGAATGQKSIQPQTNIRTTQAQAAALPQPVKATSTTMEATAPRAVRVVTLRRRLPTLTTARSWLTVSAPWITGKEPS